jgi:hypothetical protein
MRVVSPGNPVGLIRKVEGLEIDEREAVVAGKNRIVKTSNLGGKQGNQLSKYLKEVGRALSSVPPASWNAKDTFDLPTGQLQQVIDHLELTLEQLKRLSLTSSGSATRQIPKQKRKATAGQPDDNDPGAARPSSEALGDR